MPPPPPLTFSLRQAQPDNVAMQLLAEGVELEGHGGTVQLVHTSAVSGLGLADLQEALLLQVRNVTVIPYGCPPRSYSPAAP